MWISDGKHNLVYKALKQIKTIGLFYDHDGLTNPPNSHTKFYFMLKFLITLYGSPEWQEKKKTFTCISLA